MVLGLWCDRVLLVVNNISEKHIASICRVYFTLSYIGNCLEDYAVSQSKGLKFIFSPPLKLQKWPDARHGNHYRKLIFMRRTWRIGFYFVPFMFFLEEFIKVSIILILLLWYCTRSQWTFGRGYKTVYFWLVWLFSLNLHFV